MGELIVFEGIDGSGKSTQFKMMCKRLEAEGREFKSIVFPRYDKPSGVLAKMYLGGEFGKDPDSVNAYAATSFYAVDRIASYLQDWREYYESGGLVITDRYTTSNALHQGAKMATEDREAFFKWLYEYEFDYLGLPRPSHVFLMDIEAEIAAKRLVRRQNETGTDGDIHEKDMNHLENCVQSGRQVAELYGWDIVECAPNGLPRSEDEIHQELYEMLINR